MRRLLYGLVALAAGILPAAGALPAVAQPAGSIGVRLLDAPSARADDPRAHIYIVDHLGLGATVERAIEVTNTTQQPQRVELYAAAAAVTASGWTTFDGRAGNELSEMVTVTPARVDVPAGGAAQATVTLRVPTDATEREHYGVIWAQPPAASGAISVVHRVGIRMYVSIGSGAEPAADFAVESLTAGRSADGTAEVVARVRNTGGRALDLSGQLTLHEGPAGLQAGPFPTETVSTLATGATAPVRVRLDAALPAGPWTAVMTMRSGRLERVVQARITFPAAAGAEAAAVPADPVQQRRLVLLPVAVGVIALVLLGLLLRWRRGRRRDDQRPEDDRARELTTIR